MKARLSASRTRLHASAVLGTAAAVLVTTIGGGAAHGAARSPRTERVSVSPGGLPDGGSMTPTISADGRHVAFVSWARNLTPGTGPELGHIYVRDRVSNRTVLVSRHCHVNESLRARRCDHAAGRPSVAANGISVAPAISATGRFVAFLSAAGDLVGPDTNLCGWPDFRPGCHDAFVYDRDTDADGVFDEPGTTQTVLISVSSTGEKANQWVGTRPAISADGRLVAFMSIADNLVPGDINTVGDVFVHDRDADSDGVFDEFGEIATERVSVTSTGDEVGGSSLVPSMSADGSKVAFASLAELLVGGDTNHVQDVFVHDRDTNETRRVSVATGQFGKEANGISRSPSISLDGRYVAFSSLATNLVDDAMRSEHAAPEARPVAGPAMRQACTPAAAVCGDRNQVEDVFVRDLVANTTTRVSVGLSGEANGHSRLPSISGGGRYVAFYSAASNLMRRDANGHQDVFVFDRETGTTAVASVNSFGQPADHDSGAWAGCLPQSQYYPPDLLGCTPAVSSDGAVVVFDSVASNLDGGPHPIDFSHLYARDRGTCEGAGESRVPPDGPVSARVRDVAEPERSNVNEPVMLGGSRPLDALYEVACAFDDLGA